MLTNEIEHYMQQWSYIKIRQAKKKLKIIYFMEKYQYIEKKMSCWNKCSVFRSDIETM
jgi:hypothetical protein